MLTIEETLALANEDPEFSELSGPLKVFGALNGWTLDTDVSEQREMLAQFRENAPKPDPSSLPCTIEDTRITIRDGTTIQVRIYRPKDIPNDGCPGIVIYHGGGFCVGDIEFEAWLCKMFTELGGIAVDVQYRHAPEHPFPTPIHDALDGLKWVAENCSDLGINPKKGFIVGGESAGADIALAVGHLYQDEKDLPQLTGLYIAFTSAMSEETVPTKYKDHFLAMKQNAQALLLSAESIEFSRIQYKPDLKSPLASPVLFDHTGIPKTYFIACGADPLRDHTLILEQVWKDEGIPTRLDIYPGIPHAGWIFFPEANFAKKHVDDSREGLRWLLSP